MTQNTTNQTSSSSLSAAQQISGNKSSSSQQNQADFQRSLKQASKNKVESKQSESENLRDSDTTQDDKDESVTYPLQSNINLNIAVGTIKRMNGMLGDGEALASIEADKSASFSKLEPEHAHTSASQTSAVFEQWVRQSQAVTDSVSAKNNSEQSWQLSLSDLRTPMSTVVFQTSSTGQLNMHMNPRNSAQTSLLDRRLQRLRDRLTESGVSVGDLSIQGSEDHRQHSK